MSFGLNIFSSTNKKIYDSNSVTWNQVDMFLVPAGNAANKNYPYLTGRTIRVTQLFINPPPIDMEAIHHTITVSGTSVSISGGNQDAYFMVLMQ